MLEQIKQMAKELNWQTIVAIGSPVSIVLSKEVNDIISDSHFRNSVVTISEIPEQLQLIASAIYKKDEKVVAMVGNYGTWDWAVISE